MAGLGCPAAAASQQVGGLEQQRGERRAGRQARLAQGVEHVLHAVRQVGDGVEAEDAAGALDGVGGAEERGQQLAVVGPGLQLEQALLERAPVIPGLVEEGGVELRQLVELHGEAPVRARLS
jgi:hypothetical protein